MLTEITEVKIEKWIGLQIVKLSRFIRFFFIVVCFSQLYLINIFTFFFFKEIHVLLFIYLFIYLWLCWVFVSVRGLSLVAASGDHSSSRCAGFSLSRPLLLRSTGSRRAGSVVVAHGPGCSAACGILPDQGSNPCPLHWQADSQPLRHQGSPRLHFLKKTLGTSLAVQWLRLCVCTAGGAGSIPGWGTKIPHTAQCGQKIKKNFFN